MPDSATDTTEGLTSAIYNSIARQIRDGNCVLFLGPGAVRVKEPDGKFYALSELCAQYLSKNLELSAEESRSLAQVTTTLRMKGAMSDTLIIAAVQDFYKQKEKEELSPVLQELANMPFKIVINTNPDNYFTRYFAQTLRDFRFDFYNFRKPNPDPLYKFGDDQPPLIYNLFGYFQKPESLVLTYNDQLGYINKITGVQHERLPDSLLAAFNAPRFYLFLGFDFEDWTLKVLFDSLFKNARHNITPFAYPHKDMPATDSMEKVFYKSEFKMEFPPVDLETFVHELNAHVKSIDNPKGDESGIRGKALILHNEKTDDAETKTFINYLKPLRLTVTTLAQSTGQGDIPTWIKKQIDESQIVIPMITSDFFDSSNPSLPFLDELAARNNPPGKFLVMPVILKAYNLDGTSIGALPTIRPLKSGSEYNSVYGSGQENQHFTNIVRTLSTYLDSIS